MPKVKHNARKAEAAMRWLIQNRTATYRKASARFNVSVNAIRGRIEWRWGTLAEARAVQGDVKNLRVTRKATCIRCKKRKPRIGKHICSRCAERMAEQHDGVV